MMRRHGTTAAVYTEGEAAGVNSPLIGGMPLGGGVMLRFKQVALKEPEGQAME